MRLKQVEQPKLLTAEGRGWFRKFFQKMRREELIRGDDFVDKNGNPISDEELLKYYVNIPIDESFVTFRGLHATVPKGYREESEKQEDKTGR